MNGTFDGSSSTSLRRAQGVKARTLLDETLLFKTRKDPLAKHSFSESSDGIASPSQDPPGIH
ncbi:hypothetical protein ACTRXD_00020, partial [Nitrospira sp. T9]|uniref:hypothetical protein n=1 Tax=unclassified Nitrospira TaxID=2652172 RepID=UPI003F9EABA3